MANNSLKPFFTFYGGKWRAAPHYPAPMFDTIIEPFAGSAGYSMRYPDRNIVLIERDPQIAETWRYLMRVTPAEVLSLPDIGMDQTVGDLAVCEEARLLIGWWLKGGSRRPVHRPTGWMRKAAVPGYKNGGPKSWWGAGIRERIASQVEAIRHWTLAEGDYTGAPDVQATWFVDPPYDNAAGAHYFFGRDSIDYSALAEWCRGRSGQALVCEQVGATWLPFAPWRISRSSTNNGARVSREALWIGGCEPNDACATHGRCWTHSHWTDEEEVRT